MVNSIKSSFLGNNCIKLFEVEVIVGISSVHYVSIVHHIGNLFVVHGLTKLSSNFFKAFEIGLSISLMIPKLENSCDSISSFVVTNF